MSSQHATSAERTADASSAQHAPPADDGPLSHVHEHPEIEAADVDRLGRLLRAPGRILDVGAGRGGFVLLARSRGIVAYGLDLEPAAARIWRRRGVPGVLADAFRPPFRDGAFDIVRLKEIIEHVEDPRALVIAARALLRPDGCILAHVPSTYSQLYPVGNFWDDYTHVRPFSRLGLQRLMEDSGMTVVSIDGYTAGRSTIERALGKVIASVIPHTYRIVARKAL